MPAQIEEQAWQRAMSAVADRLAVAEAAAESAHAHAAAVAQLQAQTQAERAKKRVPATLSAC
jgi:cytoskeletal protein RodZ